MGLLLAYYIPLLAPEAPPVEIAPPGYEVAKATFLPNGDTVSEYVPGKGVAFAHDHGNGSRESMAGGGDIEIIRYLVEN